jgi:hypothetical protein
VDEVEYFGRGKVTPQVSAGLQIQTICAIGIKLGKKSSWLAIFLHYQVDQPGFGRVPIATVQNKHRKYTNIQGEDPKITGI